MQTIQEAERLAGHSANGEVFQMYASRAKRWCSHQIAIQTLTEACRYGEALMLLRPLYEATDWIRVLSLDPLRDMSLAMPGVTRNILLELDYVPFQDFEVEAALRKQCIDLEPTDDAVLFPLLPEFDLNLAVSTFALANRCLPSPVISFCSLLGNLLEDLSFRNELELENSRSFSQWEALSDLEDELDAMVEEVEKRVKVVGETPDDVHQEILDRYGFDLKCSCG